MKLRDRFRLLSNSLSLSVDFPLLLLPDLALFALYYELELKRRVALRQRVRDDVCHRVLRHLHVGRVAVRVGGARDLVRLGPELRVDEGLH